MTTKQTLFFFLVGVLIIFMTATCDQSCAGGDDMNCEVEWVLTLTGKYEPVAKCEKKDAGHEMDRDH